MTGLYVSIPIACFRKGLAREFLETEDLPPPATCYGFLLSLVGETDRKRHIGCRVTAGLLRATERSVVLRTVWRVKKTPLGSPGNTRPDYQQLLTGVELVMWLDASEDVAGDDINLEKRVRVALETPEKITRFGGLSLGESTHLVDEVKVFAPDASAKGRTFLLAERGRMTLPVWVDHVGSKGTRYVTGDLVDGLLTEPPSERMPQIRPPE
ncbi:MAG TPA: type I-MYXAN CRISPR-associated protein Cas5/Cmx5/DevS [Phycisphaerae bacterium]|jgi:CRISPR-associated protein Cas5t|nr:type I-MYXAN CRISPR-associated protein Cas5/Cmx5/DevS [Phycisphaerae bacterium]HOB76760.1 type I-MYXAN CRISPR-associated protein Cas5/Cmx5/DevS [Phycisphaerae bacterium]HOJ56341.1 type I-MYXAN CRISPR-associated protein Cas5/Cmx5/DevS [Phycisphaerae bacterium]HOL28497.1 type I-MYXAN CRISPR-associated protein Cas5/Cmx5/DevS [Phycisphaerae bacterium]HPP23021.1 type I-MYXAN CRISPR-associated protein Cas5/Cmx5/DevS [Phycisphaerae bacterium]